MVEISKKDKLKKITIEKYWNFRIYEVCSKSSQMNEEISLASHMQFDSDKKWEALSESLDSLGEHIFGRCKDEWDSLFLDLKVKASEKKRSDCFELIGERTSTLTKEVQHLKEQMENEYISIQNIIDEEKLKIQQNLAILRDDKTTKLEKEEVQGQDKSKGHMLEILQLATMVTGNGTQHKETVRGNSVVSSRLSTLVRETEENFAKLLFVQSRWGANILMRHTGCNDTFRNSHDNIANMIHEFSNKVHTMQYRVQYLLQDAFFCSIGSINEAN